MKNLTLCTTQRPQCHSGVVHAQCCTLLDFRSGPCGHEFWSYSKFHELLELRQTTEEQIRQDRDLEEVCCEPLALSLVAPEVSAVPFSPHYALLDRLHACVRHLMMPSLSNLLSKKQSWPQMRRPRFRSLGTTCGLQNAHVKMRQSCSSL